MVFLRMSRCSQVPSIATRGRSIPPPRPFLFEPNFADRLPLLPCGSPKLGVRVFGVRDGSETFSAEFGIPLDGCCRWPFYSRLPGGVFFGQRNKYRPAKDLKGLRGNFQSVY